jgi:hypothetical protein
VLDAAEATADNPPVERQKPDTTSNDIALYVRTMYSLLRSSGEVRVRSFEDAHAFSESSLHPGARDVAPDIGAFGYAAARLPDCMPHIERVVLGQSDDTFAEFGLDVSGWTTAPAPGRRRFVRWDGERTLAAYIVSVSDIDDLVPILTAYQIEWNKMHALLAADPVAAAISTDAGLGPRDEDIAGALRMDEAGLARLREALGARASESLAHLATHPLDLRIRLLAGSFSAYQRGADLWWGGIAPAYADQGQKPPPVYFVSSNTHALANLLGGYAKAHPQPASIREDDSADPNAVYFALHRQIERDPRLVDAVQAWDARAGIKSIASPAHVAVDAQVIELARLVPEHFDARLSMPGIQRLAQSDARIINIDYPLGMAAYHLLSRVGSGTGPLLGVYVMGKAASLNAGVGDVVISRVVHDVHSDNTYLLHNAFSAEDLAPWLDRASVLDNQKAVTVRGAFLQSATYLGVFYREGYSVLEMEAGPYLSAVYEIVDPRRYPQDEIVALGERAPFDVGILHYVSDTPTSRREQLLSQSLGRLGIEPTYACAIAIVRRIFELEITRMT